MKNVKVQHTSKFLSFYAKGMLLLSFGFLIFTLAAFSSNYAYAATGENVVNTNQQPDSSFIYETTITDLANNEGLTNEDTVQITGEAVGDIVNESIGGDHCWVTLASTEEGKDDTVQVYMSTASAKAIDKLGRYGTTGTILQITGTYHLVCAEHQGISDVHASSVTVVHEGQTVQTDPKIMRLVVGAILIVVAAIFYFLYNFLRERGR